MFNIFIGHDSNQPQNTEVCEASIRKYNKGIQVSRIDINSMKKLGYDRVNDGSTEFTYTRFLTPFLSNYTGFSLFCDSDFVWLCDPLELLGYIDAKNAVSCVKHDKMPVRSKQKMQGKVNEPYERKWWSSLMLFNCGHQFCKRLTIPSVNTLSPESLHRLYWAGTAIGSLPVKYNYLVGYYEDDIVPKALHFTDGTPMYKKYENDPFAEKYLEFI